MYQAANIPPPELHITPSHLQFGTIDPKTLASSPPAALLKITNTGGGLLAGKVLPQVSWIKVTPIEFRCPAGETSDHRIDLGRGIPYSWIWQNYSYNNLVIINSNAGAVSVGGSFLTAPGKPKIQGFPWKSLLVIPIVILLSIIFFIMGNIVRQSQTSVVTLDEISMLYTQGAGTVIAQYTLTAVSAQQINNPLETQTPTPIRLFSAPDTTEETIIEPTKAMTFTPWPREKFQNPEEFIKEYYKLVDKREYDRSWSMLTRNFQESCCSQFGNEPYNIYINFWAKVEKVEVISAYIQEWDTNPAKVVVNLHYIYKDGQESDAAQLFLLIADAERNTLLIDQVQ